MKNPHDIILRPVLTEKAYDGLADKRYVFEVVLDARIGSEGKSIRDIWGSAGENDLEPDFY